jgi:hypothetical protein
MEPQIYVRSLACPVYPAVCAGTGVKLAVSEVEFCCGWSMIAFN